VPIQIGFVGGREGGSEHHFSKSIMTLVVTGTYCLGLLPSSRSCIDLLSLLFRIFHWNARLNRTSLVNWIDSRVERPGFKDTKVFLRFSRRVSTLSRQNQSRKSASLHGAPFRCKNISQHHHEQAPVRLYLLFPTRRFCLRLFAADLALHAFACTSTSVTTFCE